jgi:predicted RNA-binding protein with RPS1 domain
MCAECGKSYEFISALADHLNIEHENQNCYLNVLDYAKRSLSITVHERKKQNDPSKQKVDENHSHDFQSNDILKKFMDSSF